MYSLPGSIILALSARHHLLFALCKTLMQIMGTNEKLNCINKKQTVKCRYEELQMLVYQKRIKVLD